MIWKWQKFLNEGRKDGLQLSHWVKSIIDISGKARPANQGDYQFAKYNRKASPISVQLRLLFSDRQQKPPQLDFSARVTEYLMPVHASKLATWTDSFDALTDFAEFVPYLLAARSRCSMQVFWLLISRLALLQVLVHKYSDEEWDNVIAKDPAWSREETDYLLELCERFQLRFLVISDRYQVWLHCEPQNQNCHLRLAVFTQSCSQISVL